MSTTAISSVIGQKDSTRLSGPRVPYSAIPRLLSHRLAFAGNSMSAQHNSDGAYLVYSYATIIATVDPSGKVDIIDANHWGCTTGRHINLCRANL